MDLQDRLTILIPTYNRKERLLGTLHSIASQGHWGEYSIVIVDNCSDYNVEDAIKNEFSEFFTCNIKFHRWFFNTGMSTNISIAFEFVDTTWCWFISDDDEIKDGAVETIINDMKRYKNSVAIKYSIQDICQYDDKIINNVKEWSNYYQIHSSGDKGYLSMLYNISLLYPYLYELTVHSYSYLSFWLPVIRALNETNYNMVMSSDILFKYKSNNDGWSSSEERYLNTLLGIRTLFDSDYNLTEDTFQQFRKVFKSDLFDSKSIVLHVLYVPDKKKRKHYFNILSPYLSGDFFQTILSKLFYYIITYFDMPPSFVREIIQKKQKINIKKDEV